MNELKLSRDITNIIRKYNLISAQDVFWNKKKCLNELEYNTCDIWFNSNIRKMGKIENREIFKETVNKRLLWFINYVKN
jgi:hypothetical protein